LSCGARGTGLVRRPAYEDGIGRKSKTTKFVAGDNAEAGGMAAEINRGGIVL